MVIVFMCQCSCLQCFDTVEWHEGHLAVKMGGWWRWGLGWSGAQWGGLCVCLC